LNDEKNKNDPLKEQFEADRKNIEKLKEELKNNHAQQSDCQQQLFLEKSKVEISERKLEALAKDLKQAESNAKLANIERDKEIDNFS